MIFGRAVCRSFGFKNSIVSCDFLNNGKNVESTSFNKRIQTKWFEGGGQVKKQKEKLGFLILKFTLE